MQLLWQAAWHAQAVCCRVQAILVLLFPGLPVIGVGQRRDAETVMRRYYNMMKSKGDANRKRRRAEREGADEAQDSDAEDAASGEDSDVGELLSALPACMNLILEWEII